MKSRSVLFAGLALSSLALAACGNNAPTPHVFAPTPSTAAAPAAASTAPAASTATPASVPAPQQTAANDTPAPPAQAYTGPALVPGVDYEEIPGGQPFAPNDGKVEVVEFFNYICPGCNAFEQGFETWEQRQAADVRITLVPATFRPDFTEYAKVYYAAQALGVAEKAHKAVFDAIHLQGILPGEGQPFDADKVAAFYAQFGVDPAQFKNTLSSFAVSGKINRAKQYMIASKIMSTPSLVVDGKYLVKGKSWDDMLRIADGLVAQQRATAGK